MSTVDYQTAYDSYLSKYMKYANYTPSVTSKTGNPINAQTSTGTYASGITDAGLFANKCTDGSDDGQINGVSKFLNACEGVLGMGKNLVTNAIKHPIKTAAMIGVCCLPYVGPALAIGMGCYGVYNGVKQIEYASEVADNATTDAEAKAAWENMGSAGATVGLSALAIKGGAGMMKGQVKSGINSYNKGVETGVGGFKQLASDTATTAMNNIKNVFSAPFNKAKEVYDGMKDSSGKITWESVSSYAKGKWVKATENVTEKAGKFGRKIDEKVTSSKTNKTTLERLKQGVGKEGSNITQKGGKYYEILDDGTTVEYSRSGAKISETTMNGANKSTTKYVDGKTVVKDVVNNPDGTTTVKTETIDGDITTIEQYQVDTKGKTVNSQKIARNNATGYETMQNSDGSSYKMNTNTGESVNINPNGNSKKTYFDGNETVDFSSLDVKKQIEVQKNVTDTTSAKTTVDKIIDSQIPGLAENTNPFLMGAGTLEWLEEMDK